MVDLVDGRGVVAPPGVGGVWGEGDESEFLVVRDVAVRSVGVDALEDAVVRGAGGA